MKTIAFAFAIAVVAACSKDRAAAAVIDTANEVQTISAIRDREIAFFSAGQVDSLAALLTIDVQIMPPNEPVVVGVAAAKAWAQGLANQFTVAARYTGASVTFAGDIAVEQYTAEMTVTPKAGGAPMTEKIKGMHVYRRQADGSWKIAQDVWNSDTAPPPPPSATPRR